MIKHKIMMETFRLGCLLYILVVKVGDITLEDHFKPVLETTTQDQYIGFNVGSAILLGSNPDNLTRYSEVLAVGTLWVRHLLVVKR
jgi:hypothetical protein